MVPYELVRRVVLGTQDQAEKKIRFMALLTAGLPKGGPKPVLAGGSAIEVYMWGTLRTGDMDVVYDIKSLERLLRRWKFERVFRSWANEELGLSVDPVGTPLEGSYDRVTTIVTPSGPAAVIGREDLMLKRLASAKRWKYPSDMEQAYLLARAYGDKLDWKYIEEAAERGGTSDHLAKLKRMLKGRTGQDRGRRRPVSARRKGRIA
ncbi:MAG: hypothetical protein JRN24_00085 [Nitrososphaerota archaeon]|nr:hypothetical protein [Nitrososphaerota archaeon]